MGCSSAKRVAELNAPCDEHGLFHHKYHLGDCVGKGSFGTVFLASRLDSGATRAVKIVALKGYGVETDSPYRRKAFCNEQKAWVSAGQHPNVCFLQEWYMDFNFGYFVMECCQKSLLSAWSNEQHLNEHTYAKYFKDMASGLAHIHSLGVVHRDVKHDNFLLGGPSGRTTMLCDFGLAALASDRSAMMMKEKGTPPYMAPEMLSRRAKCGPACDVWSLGVMVYMAFFGCWPYAPEKSTPKAMKEAIRFAAKPPPLNPPECYPQVSFSDAALEFVCALLDRNSDTRPSASDCLRMDYLFNKDRRAISVVTTDLANISLSEMLDGAIACAAFSTKEPQADPFNLLTLQKLQAAAQRGQTVRRRSGKSLTNTSVQLELVKKDDSADHTMIWHPFAAP